MADNRQRLKSLMNHAVRSELRAEDLREYGVPKQFDSAVMQEARAIRRLFESGDRAGARRRASEAALILSETVELERPGWEPTGEGMTGPELIEGISR